MNSVPLLKVNAFLTIKSYKSGYKYFQYGYLVPDTEQDGQQTRDGEQEEGSGEENVAGRS